ncbi:hypothetical protein FDECE_16013 [Fusarium decemcellulare]|nr:hypothetical protein FDECE_16013 [Fusarium decemcellulare]
MSLKERQPSANTPRLAPSRRSPLHNVFQRLYTELKSASARSVVSGDVSVADLLKRISSQPDVLTRAKEAAPLTKPDGTAIRGAQEWPEEWASNVRSFRNRAAKTNLIGLLSDCKWIEVCQPWRGRGSWNHRSNVSTGPRPLKPSTDNDIYHLKAGSRVPLASINRKGIAPAQAQSSTTQPPSTDRATTGNNVQARPGPECAAGRETDPRSATALYKTDIYQHPGRRNSPKQPDTAATATFPTKIYAFFHNEAQRDGKGNQWENDDSLAVTAVSRDDVSPSSPGARLDFSKMDLAAKRRFVEDWYRWWARKHNAKRQMEKERSQQEWPQEENVNKEGEYPAHDPPVMSEDMDFDDIWNLKGLKSTTRGNPARRPFPDLDDAKDTTTEKPQTFGAQCTTAEQTQILEASNAENVSEPHSSPKVGNLPSPNAGNIPPEHPTTESYDIDGEIEINSALVPKPQSLVPHNDHPDPVAWLHGAAAPGVGPKTQVKGGGSDDTIMIMFAAGANINVSRHRDPTQTSPDPPKSADSPGEESTAPRTSSPSSDKGEEESAAPGASSSSSDKREESDKDTNKAADSHKGGKFCPSSKAIDMRIYGVLIAIFILLPTCFVVGWFLLSDAPIFVSKLILS